MAELDRVIHEPARLLRVALLRNIEKADFLFLLNESGLAKSSRAAFDDYRKQMNGPPSKAG